MRITFLTTIFLMLLYSSAFANPPVTSMGVDCNWGKLTADAIKGGFPQGEHASDPSGDGKGKEDRVGLANVIELGNLQALCEFIASLSEEGEADSNQPAISSMSIDCNWGTLTAEAIHNGFPQGAHASDPSGDGKGKEDRVGLANVINQGDLQALCEFIQGAP